MKLCKVAVPPANVVFQLSLLFDPQDELGVLMLSNRMLNLSDAHTGNVDIPAVDVVPLGQGVHHPSLDSIAIHDLNL